MPCSPLMVPPSASAARTSSSAADVEPRRRPGLAPVGAGPRGPGAGCRRRHARASRPARPCRSPISSTARIISTSRDRGTATSSPTFQRSDCGPRPVRRSSTNRSASAPATRAGDGAGGGDHRHQLVGLPVGAVAVGLHQQHGRAVRATRSVPLCASMLAIVAARRAARPWTAAPGTARSPGRPSRPPRARTGTRSSVSVRTGIGRSRTVAPTTTPSVPSLPTSSPTRSRPVTPLMVRCPVLIRRAVGEHDVQREHRLAGHSVLHAAQAAGVGGDVAADGREGVAGRVGGVPQADRRRPRHPGRR